MQNDELLPVRQADREAALKLLPMNTALELERAMDVRSGRRDGDATVQAFARHRIAHSGEGREDVDYWNEIAQRLGHESVCEALEKLAELQDAGEGRSNGAGEDAEHALKWINHNLLLAEGLMKSSADAGNGYENFRAHDAYRALTVAKKAIAASQGEVERGGAIDDIAAERRRQVEAEGWTPEHDDEHGDGSLAAAAATYAFSAATAERYLAADPIGFWPWAREWWKPSTPRRDLVKAGALIVAEIERIDRTALAQPKGGDHG